MPWTLDDYPNSLKNLPYVTKKKAIDIANALVTDGYEEERAIPIATEQAKEWADHATEKEKSHYEKHGKVTEHQVDDSARPALLEKDVLVVWQEDKWAVRTKTAKKASKLFQTKEKAVAYGKEVAENKGTTLHIYKKDGTVESKIKNA